MAETDSRNKTIAFTCAALIAFAANSLFCRLALGEQAIDAASFTAIRLLSGALTLVFIATVSGHLTTLPERGNWISALALFIYAVGFSFAYISISAGTGGLILFGAVQVTMILWGLKLGERPPVQEWLGLIAAIGGLVYLLLPGLDAPPLKGASMMLVAGIAWGVFSLRGRGSNAPLLDMTQNFIRALPFALITSIIAIDAISISLRGVILGVLSGALASGVGYVFWYAALRHLTAIHAASAQVLVPILISVGGIVFLGEALTLRLMVATVIVLGGIVLAMTARRTGG